MQRKQYKHLAAKH